jgi:S1-C subfamily serine protease
VTTSAELRELIGRSKIGETINLTIVRNEKEKDVAVRLMSRKNN